MARDEVHTNNSMEVMYSVRNSMNTNSSVKWRFSVPKTVEQINDYLFIDSYNSNKI